MNKKRTMYIIYLLTTAIKRYLSDKRTARIVFILLVFFFLVSSELPLLGEQKKKRPISVGYITNMIYGVDQRDANIAMEILTAKIIGEKFPDRESKSVFLTNIEQATEASRRGELDLLNMLSIDYLKVRDKIDAAPVAVGSVGGKAETEYLLLVKKNSGISNISQLKNKKLNVCKGGTDVIGLLWLDEMLMRNGYGESNVFFKIVDRVDKPAMAILPVFFGRREACIVFKHSYETMVDLNPQVGSQLVVLKKSPPLVFTISCLHNNAEKDVWNVISQFFQEDMNSTPEKRQIFTLFQVKGLIKYQPEYLINLEKLYNSYQAFKKTERINNKGKSL